MWKFSQKILAKLFFFSDVQTLSNSLVEETLNQDISIDEPSPIYEALGDSLNDDLYKNS